MSGLVRVVRGPSAIRQRLTSTPLQLQASLQTCCSTRRVGLSRPSILVQPISVVETRHHYSHGPKFFGKAPVLLDPHVLVDEEQVVGHDRSLVYHPDPGDVLDDGRYELKVKIGFGRYSTVWLAEDLKSDSQERKYVTVKINSSDLTTEDGSTREFNMFERIASGNMSHKGASIIRFPTAAFDVDGVAKDQRHTCLVFPPMREPYSWFKYWLYSLHDGTGSLILVKIHLWSLLEGLDFLHTEAKLVHTDLKWDNVLVDFESESVIEDFLQDLSKGSYALRRKHLGDGKFIYLCCNEFGRFRADGSLANMCPQFIDFGMAQEIDGKEPRLLPIQPHAYRAPEVLLGTGWSSSVDMWNFGAMVWELLAGKSLFCAGDTEYSPATHIAEMISLLGPIPTSVLEREREMRIWRFEPPIKTLAEDAECNSIAQLFGGPFFDNDGNFLHEEMVDRSRSLEKEMPSCIPEEQREQFLGFIRSMLTWDPEKRATARELVEDEWLKEAIKICTRNK